MQTVRTCSSQMQLNMRIFTVCMRESGSSDGHVCFCEGDLCNASTSLTDMASSVARAILFLLMTSAAVCCKGFSWSRLRHTIVLWVVKIVSGFQQCRNTDCHIDHQELIKSIFRPSILFVKIPLLFPLLFFLKLSVKALLYSICLLRLTFYAFAGNQIRLKI